MVVVWGLLAAAGLGLAAYSSTRAVDHAVRAASGLRIPAFVVGMTLLAVGTDLPEIANSIAASVAGHGDINVGDSVGSSLTQATLVIGLMAFATHAVPVPRKNVLLLGGLAAAAVLFGLVLMRDGNLSRVDGGLLVGAWVLSMAITAERAAPEAQPELPLPDRHPLAHAGLALLLLVLVAAGATLAVQALVQVAMILGLPEFLISFVGLALGTSLPELTVAVTAVRRGQADLAFGDALGATLADASLSIGSGPLIAPTLVTTGLVVRGALFAALGIIVTTLVLGLTGKHNRWTGGVLVATYLACITPILLAG
ncbi:MAG: hypothetical protein R3320_05835 [Nitriliruptorales bacterium]|nr:hypothetical protein [Nitriliruptorales bacterium]